MLFLPAIPAPSVTHGLGGGASHLTRCCHVAATGAAVKPRPRCGNVDDGIGDGTGAGTVQLHHTTSFLHQAPCFFCGTVLPLIELCEGGRCLRLRLGHHLFFACCSSTMAWRVASSASERSATQPLQKSSEKSARPSAGPKPSTGTGTGAAAAGRGRSVGRRPQAQQLPIGSVA